MIKIDGKQYDVPITELGLDVYISQEHHLEHVQK